MTGVNRGIEYPLFHEILHTASPAQTSSAWLLEPVLIKAKYRSVYSKHLAPENQLIAGS